MNIFITDEVINFSIFIFKEISNIKISNIHWIRVINIVYFNILSFWFRNAQNIHTRCLKVQNCLKKDQTFHMYHKCFLEYFVRQSCPSHFSFFYGSCNHYEVDNNNFCYDLGLDNSHDHGHNYVYDHNYVHNHAHFYNCPSQLCEIAFTLNTSFVLVRLAWWFFVNNSLFFSATRRHALKWEYFVYW